MTITLCPRRAIAFGRLPSTSPKPPVCHSQTRARLREENSQSCMRSPVLEKGAHSAPTKMMFMRFSEEVSCACCGGG